MSADFTPEKEDLKILTPFKMQVLTNFPYIEADFDALTNYQLLCKVVEYLNNVIKETNEVTEQTLTLYNAFVALEHYVNNYFDNLDISSEVNEKLDEMAESGALADMIADYIKLKGLLVYNNVEELSNADNVVNGSFCMTYGFYNAKDGGGSYYKVRTVTNEDVVDNITIIALPNETLIAELITSEVNVMQFGCYGDGVHDDSTNFNKALNYARDNNLKVVSPKNKTYLVNTALNISLLTIDLNNSTLITNQNINILYINTGLLFGYVSNINIDCNNKANAAIYIDSGRNYHFSNITIDNIKVYGIYYNLGFENHFNDIWLRSYPNNNDSIAIYCVSSDCHFNNVIIRDCHVGIKINGTNWFNNIHGWFSSSSKDNFYQSRLIEVVDGKFMGNQILSDTYHYGIYFPGTTGEINIDNMEYIQNFNILSQMDIHSENIYTIYQNVVRDNKYSSIVNLNNNGYELHNVWSAFSNRSYNGKVSFTSRLGLNINTLLYSLTNATGVSYNTNVIRNYSNNILEMEVVGSVDTSQLSSLVGVNLGTIPDQSLYPSSALNSYLILSDSQWNSKEIGYMYIGNNGVITTNLEGKTGTVYFKIFMQYLKRY